jgi:DNA polymerase III delta prime subunit
MSLVENALWFEKYRPRTVAETILPKQIKEIFQKFVDAGSIPNLLLVGRSGTGKTTVARAMCEELGCDYIVINASMHGNIDTLRNKIMEFVSTVSLVGGRKYVILDEFDYSNPTSFQPAFRNFMEEFSGNAGFIMTANFASRIIEAIHSRCSVVEFKIPKAERQSIAGQFFKRTLQILAFERVEYEQKAVAEIVGKFFPDMRRVINELQTAAAVGKIDSGSLARLDSSTVDQLIELVKAKNFTEARKWVAENLEAPSDFFRKLYDSASKKAKPQCIPALVLLIAKYQYQAAFVADQEVNVAAFVAELMLEDVYD